MTRQSSRAAAADQVEIHGDRRSRVIKLAYD